MMSALSSIEALPLMPVTTPIYDSSFLADAEDWLALRPGGDIASFTLSHDRKPLPPGLIADLQWRREHLADRPARTVIRPRVVLLTQEQALPARLRLEYITDGPVSGTLYPSVAMAGVSSDATWDGAVGAAERLAKEEGFGIPALEALTYGCPVCSSNAGALREVGGDLPIYFDPTDESQISAALIGAAERKDRNQLIQAGIERSKLFGWDKSADVVLSTFQSR
jgi:hypothetical protein